MSGSRDIDVAIVIRIERDQWTERNPSSEKGRALQFYLLTVRGPESSRFCLLPKMQQSLSLCKEIGLRYSMHSASTIGVKVLASDSYPPYHVTVPRVKNVIFWKEETEVNF